MKIFGIGKSIGFGIGKFGIEKKYRNRYRKNLVLKKYRIRYRKNLVSEKKFRIRFRSDFWYCHTLISPQESSSKDSPWFTVGDAFSSNVTGFVQSENLQFKHYNIYTRKGHAM